MVGVSLLTMVGIAGFHVKVVGGRVVGRVGSDIVVATPLVIYVKVSAPALLVSPITIRLGLTVAASLVRVTVRLGGLAVALVVVST